jgi:hypothetical protein
MKKVNFLLLALAMVAISGCSVIAGIFKAGVAVGVISIVVVIIIIIWLISMFRSK